MDNRVELPFAYQHGHIADDEEALDACVMRNGEYGVVYKEENQGFAEDNESV